MVQFGQVSRMTGRMLMNLLRQRGVGLVDMIVSVWICGWVLNAVG
jgi:hypothetical protein